MDTKQILILIGFAIYYFLRSSGDKDKKQKKTAPKRPQRKPSSAKPQKSIEELLRDLAGHDEKVEKPKSKPIPQPKQYDDHVPERPTHHVHKPLHVVEHDDDDHANDTGEFDLRQAVINDAILNRPWE